MRTFFLLTILLSMLADAALAAPAARATVQGPIALKATADAVIARVEVGGPVLHRLDVVRLSRQGQALGESVVIGTFNAYAALSVPGGKHLQAGEKIEVVPVRSAPPHDEKMAEGPWSGGFPPRDEEVEATFHRQAPVQPTLPPSLGYKARWIETTGDATVRNRGKETLSDVTVDVYVNGGWVAQQRIGTLAPGGSKTVRWSCLDAGLENVPSAAAPSAVVVMRWEHGGVKYGLRARASAR